MPSASASALLVDRLAVEAVQLADPAAAQSRQIALGVVVDGGGEPGALVGDRGQGLAVGRDMQVRPAAEAGANWPSSKCRRARSGGRRCVAAGSSILRGRATSCWMSSACSCAPAGGGDAPAQAAASRQTTKRERTAACKARPSSRPSRTPPCDAVLRRRDGPILPPPALPPCRRAAAAGSRDLLRPLPRRTARRAAPSSCRPAGRRRRW